MDGIHGDKQEIENIICGRDLPQFPFEIVGDEQSNMKDEEYIEMVKKGIAHCNRGDVFQIVLSRRFQQQFKGDEFNVYRSLRMVNPSPYLFFFAVVGLKSGGLFVGAFTEPWMLLVGADFAVVDLI